MGKNNVELKNNKSTSMGGKKSKKNGFLIDDNEYSIGTELSEYSVLVPESKVAPLGKQKKTDLNNEDEQVEDDYGVPVIKFDGRKKSKGKKSACFSASSFVLLGEDEDENDYGRKDNDEELGSPVIAFSGKKKHLKSGCGVSSAFDLLGKDKDDSSKEEDEDIGITFTGKKKKSSKGLNKASGNSLDEENGEDASVSNESSKIWNGDASSDFVEPEKRSDDSKIKKQTAEDPTDTSKNKKKKKKKNKGGKTGDEEDDLDKILAELGVVLPESTCIAAPTVVQHRGELEEAAAADKENEDEGPVGSVTSKKKKKKKDKEKEKKAAQEKQEETKIETNSNVLGKKVPKHVREILAKQKEAEERKKQEKEERQRKEEEEQRRVEEEQEEQRLMEEKKRLKREKEKEKLLKKKQEGKILTAKQKEEVRKREAMRTQFLANAGGLQLPSGEPSAKRPLYQKKKAKAQQAQPNGASASDNVEITDSKEIQHEFSLARDSDAVDLVEENGVHDEEEDEEWDANSWDDSDLKLPGKSAFEDEDVDTKPQPKEIKNSRNATQDVELASITTKPRDFIEEKKNIKQVPKEESPNSDDKNELRSPICCIMGHVDTGKTKLLDYIRGTNVQEGEACGITQQIGVTYFPAENIRERTRELKADAKLNVPGLLLIDTPGHESFTNLRSRGSGLCEIAILVVDIMHGLEPQTIESLNLLKMRNTDFIVALNKVDRLYGWKTCRNAPIAKAMKQQSKQVQMLFNDRLIQIITQFKEQGLNTELYYKNKDRGDTFNIVPTSAISGEGIPDILLLLVQWTQKTMIERLTFSKEVECTVLEVKVIEGHGTTIDVVLVNGVLHEGDQIVVCGLQGPIVTTIRSLLTPHPMKELRVKGTYLHHKEIKAAQGIKITAQGLEHAIAGTSLYVVGPDDDLEDVKNKTMEDMKSVMSRIDKSGEGVYVQASTLGSLEALLELLKTPVNIPVRGISIGPVHKKDVMKASVMLEKINEYATILAFDVKVTQEARELADELGVRIFTADSIYQLLEQFKAYINNLKEERKREAAEEAVFPCVLKIVPNCVFNKKDPIVLGVDVVEGTLKIGTPICVPQKEFIEIGRIASIENNHKPVDYAKKGQSVAIKIVGSNSEDQQKTFGRHFDIDDELVSKISRSSLDALKQNYKDEISQDEKNLLFKLKRLFKIP
ncbi:hypothetical protein ABFX02_02G022900 [Erythranthe guttata]